MPGSSTAANDAGRHPGTVREVFAIFLRLGVTSFGGPVAHLGYFREAFVQRRKWFGERAYADLVALCQFLPGPASSQVGMAIGLHRAGLGGLLAAWCGFTLPSAILLVLFAFGVTVIGDATGSGWIHGLKAAAAAVVTQAVFGMAKTLTPDRKRATIAAAAMIAVLLIPNPIAQVGVIIVAGLIGLVWLKAIPDESDDRDSFQVQVGRRAAVVSLIIFATLLAALPLIAAVTGNGVARLFDLFYRSGALVFGGGHVVLPLLQAETVPNGLVDHDAFLAGYGAAQAVPGPLFTFAAYLGTITNTAPSGILGAAIALVAIFLPSALLIIGAVPFWTKLRHAPVARRALMGINAGVVGLLAAALYTPVITGSITSIPALVIAVAAFITLTQWKAPPWAVVIAAGIAGYLVL